MNDIQQALKAEGLILRFNEKYLGEDIQLIALVLGSHYVHQRGRETEDEAKRVHGQPLDERVPESSEEAFGLDLYFEDGHPFVRGVIAFDYMLDHAKGPGYYLRNILNK